MPVAVEGDRSVAYSLQTHQQIRTASFCVSDGHVLVQPLLRYHTIRPPYFFCREKRTHKSKDAWPGWFLFVIYNQILLSRSEGTFLRQLHTASRKGLEVGTGLASSDDHVEIRGYQQETDHSVCGFFIHRRNVLPHDNAILIEEF